MTFILNNALITPNIGLMFWTLLTFIVLLVLLSKFAWKPIMNGIRSREVSIQNALNEAKKAREEMKSLRSENESLLAEARAERDKILKEGREIREKMIADAKGLAQEEARHIVTQAKESIEKEKLAAMKELREQVVDLSIQAATKILKRELDNKKVQEQLVEAYLNDVNAA
jgi:F-type H+-transporting ATPase subunit b